jgi:hypothetical protein
MIQPKWGFVPDKYSRGCRFCIHDTIKVSDGLKKRSSFCPLNLFSENLLRIKKSMTDLLLLPSNNLRVFKNGESILATLQVVLILMRKMKLKTRIFF